MSDNSVDVLFRTRAELQGARQFADELERQIGRAKALGKDYSDLEAQLNKVRKAMESSAKPAGPGVGEMFTKVREGLGDVIPGFAKLDGMLSGLGAGAIGAMAGIVGGLETAKHALLEFAHAEEEVAKLDAALAQTQQLTDDYREHLQELANQLQETTGVANEQWLGALTRLTQFGAKSDNIEQYSEAVKNLAGLMGGDVASAANVFSRALQGNFEVFGRYGIVVEDAGTKTEKLSKLMEQLALRGGGQLEASNRTLLGQFKSLGNSVSDVMKEFGRLISSTGVVQAAAGGLAAVFSFIANTIGGVIPKVDGLHNSVDAVADSMDDANKAAKAFSAAQNEIRAATDGVTSAILRQIEAIRTKQRAEDEISDAQLALNIAKIDRQEKEHKLNPEQAIRLRAGARIASEASKTLRANAADEAEIQAKKEQKAGISGKMNEAASDVDRQQGVVDSFQDFINRRRVFEIDMRKRRDLLEAAQKEVFENVGPARVDGRKIKPHTNPQEFEANNKLFADLFAKLNTQETAGKAGFSSEFKNKFQIYGVTSIPEEQARLQKAKDELGGFLAEQFKLIDSISAEISKLEAKVEQRKRVGAIKQKTEAESTAGDVSTARETESKRQEEADKKRIEDYIKMHGKAPTAQAEQTAQAIVAALDQINSGYMGALKDVLAQVNDIQQDVATLRSQAATGRA